MKRMALFVRTVTVLLLCVLGLTRTRPLASGVWGVELAAGCRVEIYSPSQQLRWTLVWSCPGDEITRFWPWPMQYPWFEKPLPTPRPNGQEMNQA